MLVSDEDECGAGYFGDPAGAGGNVLEVAPALGEAGRTGVPRGSGGRAVARSGAAVAGIQFRDSRLVFYRDEDACPGTLVGGVGENRQPERGALETRQGAWRGITFVWLSGSKLPVTPGKAGRSLESPWTL